jgi:hypothetical protein
MKTFIAILASVIVSFGASTASAATPGTDLMYKAAYSIMGEKSYYDASGNLLATSRFVTDASLPLNAIKKLMKKCPDHEIRYIREFQAEGINTYIITLENKTGFKVVRYAENTLTILQKLDKN